MLVYYDIIIILMIYYALFIAIALHYIIVISWYFIITLIIMPIAITSLYSYFSGIAINIDFRAYYIAFRIAIVSLIGRPSYAIDSYRYFMPLIFCHWYRCHAHYFHYWLITLISCIWYTHWY